MTDKKFLVAGASTLNGKTKLRFANDGFRAKILIKNNHQDIELVDLPHEMTKAEAVAHLASIGFGSDKPAIKAALDEAVKKYPTPVAQEATPSVTAEEAVVE